MKRRKIERVIYLRIPLTVYADTEAGVKRCIRYAIDRSWFDMSGAGIDGSYTVTSGKPVVEPRECICVNEATSRNCPVHGELQEGKEESRE